MDGNRVALKITVIVTVKPGDIQTYAYPVLVTDDIRDADLR